MNKLDELKDLITALQKKEEEKQIIDLDQGLLYDDEPEDNEDAAEEATEEEVTVAEGDSTVVEAPAAETEAAPAE